MFRRSLGALTALLFTTALVGAFDVTPAVAALTATFSNPTPIHGQNDWAQITNSTQITLSSSGTPLGSTYPSTIHVGKVPGTTTRAEVKLDLEHSAPDDLDILLVTPTGRSVVLMSDAGGLTDFSGTLSFDTTSTTSVPDSGQLSSNVNYAATNWVGNDAAGDTWPAPAPSVANPQATLGSVESESPDGDWHLFVRDDQDQDGGVLHSWRLTVFTNALPTPAATYPAPLSVSGLSGTVTDIDVTLKGVTWTYSSGLDAMLVSPGGRKAVVLSDIGGDQDISGATLTLDDEAASAMSGTTAPTSGRYRPTNLGDGDHFPAPAPDGTTAGSALSIFDGANPNGTWKLYLVDDSPFQDVSVVAGGWSLKITTNGSPSPRITSTAPTSGAVGVWTSATLHAKASKALAGSTVTTTTAYLRRYGSSVHVAAAVSYQSATHTIVINPTHHLRSHTRYVAVVTTWVRDTAGHRLDQSTTQSGLQSKTWTFTTK